MAVHIYLHMTPLRLPALTRFYLACTLMTLSTHLSFHLSMATFGTQFMKLSDTLTETCGNSLLIPVPCGEDFYNGRKMETLFDNICKREVNL